MKTKLIIVGMLVAIFSFTAMFAFAASNDPWFVIKDKAGVCKVIQAKDKTPATISGPHKTKSEARKARGKACEGLFNPKPRKLKSVPKTPDVKPAAKPEVKPEVKPEAKPVVK
jgi:hypothetical protein